MRRELLAFKLFQCLSDGSSPPLSTFIIAFLSSLDSALCYIGGGLILARTHLGMGPGKVPSPDWDHTFPFSESEELCQVWYFITARGPQRRQWHLTPVLLPGKSHGRRSLVGCSPWGCEELDTTERLHFHFSLSCTGEGNGNPLQCSCLENPRDGGAWWAAFYGVAQSQTQLKRLSSSSSSRGPRNSWILILYPVSLLWCPGGKALPR